MSTLAAAASRRSRLMAAIAAPVPIRPFWMLPARTSIFIPRLCELEGLSTVGACRLCLVEVKGTNKLAARLRDSAWKRAWRSPPLPPGSTAIAR